MSAPHEEEWEWDAEAGEVVRPCGLRPTEVEPVDFSDEESGTLAAAAPDMARALRAVLTCQNKGPCRTCEMTIRSALTKAGVPLP